MGRGYARTCNGDSLASQTSSGWLCDVNFAQLFVVPSPLPQTSISSLKNSSELELLAVVIVLFAPILHETLTNSNLQTPFASLVMVVTQMP